MRPTKEEYAPFYETYISKVTAANPQQALEQSLQEALQFLREIPEEKENYRYQPGKWSVKELLQHVIDTERVMVYRALRFGRGDATELKGFDEDAYVEGLEMEGKSLSELVEEYLSQRKATISLFGSFPADVMLRKGVASGHPVSVRALAYIIAGHQKHHFQIVRERYF